MIDPTSADQISASSLARQVSAAPPPANQADVPPQASPPPPPPPPPLSPEPQEPHQELEDAPVDAPVQVDPELPPSPALAMPMIDVEPVATSGELIAAKWYTIGFLTIIGVLLCASVWVMFLGARTVYRAFWL